MKTKFTTVALILASGLIAGNSALAGELYPSQYAADTTASTVTRAQVQTELAEALRSGDIVGGETSQKLKELNSGRYAAQPVASTVTRAQVRAELAEAIRTGDIVAGNSGLKLNQLYPNRYSSI